MHRVNECVVLCVLYGVYAYIYVHMRVCACVMEFPNRVVMMIKLTFIALLACTGHFCSSGIC